MNPTSQSRALPLEPGIPRPAERCVVDDAFRATAAVAMVVFCLCALQSCGSDSVVEPTQAPESKCFPSSVTVLVSEWPFGHLSVIERQTGRVRRIPIGVSPAGMAVRPDGSFVYVADRGSNSLAVMDMATYTVASVVAVGPTPGDVAITPDGTFAYVTNEDLNGYSAVDTVSVIDLNTNAVVASVEVGNGLADVAIGSDGHFAYVANFLSNSVSVIDVTSNTVAATIPVVSPSSIAVDREGKLAYVTSQEVDQLAVIDLAARRVAATIPAGHQPTWVVLTPDGARAYVVNRFSGYLSLIDLTTLELKATMSFGRRLGQLAITGDGACGFLADEHPLEHAVLVIDLADHRVERKVSVGQGPRHLAIYRGQ